MNVYIWDILVLLDHSTSTIIFSHFLGFLGLAQCMYSNCHKMPNIQQTLVVFSHEGVKLEKFCAANKFDEKSGSDAPGASTLFPLFPLFFCSLFWG